VGVVGVDLLALPLRFLLDKMVGLAAEVTIQELAVLETRQR
jgi:hypothetical protein